MESIVIVFWIILLASNVQKTDSAIDDLMYEAEEKYKKLMPKYSALRLPSEDDTGYSEDLFNYKVRGRKEKFIKLQYDMILKREQYNTLIGNDLVLPEPRSRRNAIINNIELWPHGTIHYTIDDSFSNSSKLSIDRAFGMWRKWTCLTFVQATNNEYNKVKIEMDESGCGSSSVGMIQGEQYISLSRTCSTDVRSVVHEIGHAIGLLHEQMRHDRDEYVTVNYDNIIDRDGATRQFAKIEQGGYYNLSKPYDYLSIMHYGKLFMSRDRKANLVTISPKNESYLDIIGEVQTISYHDVKSVCQLYNCSDRCDSTCSGNGFMGAQCQCMCRGPTDKKPIKLCRKQDSCTMPTVDYSKYVVFNKHYKIVSKNSGLFTKGTELLIEWKDIDECGQESSTYRCHNGVWIGNLPECNRGCGVDTYWVKHYNICEYDQTSTESGIADSIEYCDPIDLLDKYEHGDNITLSCKSDIETRSTSQCNNGSWSIIIINCPEEMCPNNDIPAIPNSVVTQSDYSQRINYNEASIHSAEISFRCNANHEMFDSDTNKYLDAVVVNVKCAFGKWIPKFCALLCVTGRGNVNDVTPNMMSVSHASGYFFVTAPNMFRYQTDENVLVGVFDRSNADIKIWLEYDYFKNGEQKTKQFSRKSVRVQNQENPRLETIRVDENDIFDLHFNDAIGKPVNIRLVAFDGNIEKKVDIILSYDSGYLIVHTDKSIYTPRQNVYIRVLALDEYMSNAFALDETDNKNQVVMDFVSPSGITMSRSYGKPSNDRGKTPFYTSEFAIPTNTELGTWTIVTNFTGQFETSEQTMFEIEEYVLPTLTVTVTTNVSYFLETTERYQVRVDAKFGLCSIYAQQLMDDSRGTGQLSNPNLLLSVDNGAHVFTVNAKEIVNSGLRKERKGRFPIGEYLTIRADVFESATGNEEIGWNTDIIFADKPYKFTYERSKHNYRPGWVYFFKVDVLLPNGDKAINVELQVNYKQGREVKTKIKITDKIGQCNILFSTRGSTQTEIIFEVNVGGIIDTFLVKPYTCAKQLQVEQIERYNRIWISMNSDMIQGVTGLLFVIMSRGKIIEWKYRDPSFEYDFELRKEILMKLTPDARVLVFYVYNNAVVADSVKFDMDAFCRGEELRITTDRKYVDPGQVGQLTIEGPSDMIVGLNVMDTSLLQLNGENILHRTKMFKAMTSHDRGCGEGSGSTAEEVFMVGNCGVLYGHTGSTVDAIFKVVNDCIFSGHSGITVKNSGLTLVTNAAIANDRLERTYIECPKYIRRKRSGDLRSRERRSSLDGKSDYNIDLLNIKKQYRWLRQRSDFRESWLFTDVNLEYGHANVILKYPDSITQWMIQAIGFSAQDGMCISNPVYVKADRDFFIQLDIPYQAVRLEHINVKATIFNYGYNGQDDKTINVYLHGQKDMCSAARPGETSDMVKLRMAPNTTQTVTFPIIPLTSSTPGKQLAIEVTAFVERTLVYDAISKIIYIINEGIEQNMTINVCLDPGKENNDCKPSMTIVNSDYDNTYEQHQTITVDLSLPKDAIPGTGTAIAYIKTSSEVDLQLTFSADGWDKSGYTETVTKENINVLKIVENLPVETHDNKLIINVTGTGSARIDIDLRYSIPKPYTPCSYKVSNIDIKPAKYTVEIDQPGRECDVCGYCNDNENSYFDAQEDHQYHQKGLKEKICMSFSVRYVDQYESGMTIVKVNLQTGMQAFESDLEKLLKDGIIDRYELTYNKKGFIVFYMDKIGHDAKEIRFRLIDEFDGNKDTRQGSSVHMYDYYRPDRSCQITYGFGNDRGPLETKCIGRYKVLCQCVQKLCPKKPDMKYFKNPRKYKPVFKLIKRTCNSNVTDYSILVKIIAMFGEENQKKSSATVLKVFKKGSESLVENESTITFTWNRDCMYPDFVKGKKYYVIAKDGPRTRTDGVTGYTYPLKDKAVVIERLNSKDRTLRKVYHLLVMMKYEKDMKNYGCNMQEF